MILEVVVFDFREVLYKFKQAMSGIAENSYLSIPAVHPPSFTTRHISSGDREHMRNVGKEASITYNAELSNLSECSLNLRMSGSAPR